jgi:eukaryotic-like serine/threonine-protein kinase
MSFEVRPDQPIKVSDDDLMPEVGGRRHVVYVAIKVLPDLFADDPARLARFQREAELLASLNHPNIAAVYGLEKADGLTGIVLELVDGETLADLIARGPVAVTDALSLARQVAEALEAAHDKGIIHRDLKPANVKVTPDGKVKVLDFGLAKLVEPEMVASTLSMSPTLSVQATHAGVILGTAAYMSPEQARGKPVDRRTDIWAFGCVLFEMLTGQQTFDVGDTVSDAVASILKNDPDWTRLPAGTPQPVWTLLRRCLLKDVQKWLPHIGVARLEIEEALLASVAQRTAATAGQATARTRLLPWAVTTAALAVAGARARDVGRRGERRRPQSQRGSASISRKRQPNCTLVKGLHGRLSQACTTTEAALTRRAALREDGPR